MIAAAAAWWRSRTGRERLLLTVAGAAIGVVFLPFLAYGAAADFRKEAAAELEAARRLERDVRALSGQGRALPGVPGEGGLQSLATANAAALSLDPVTVESDPGGGLRIAFAPSRSIDIYRWMTAVTNRGAFITQTSMVREGDADLVRASFVLSETPA